MLRLRRDVVAAVRRQSDIRHPIQFPVFINCRDRLTPLVQLVEWLERAGQDEIYLIDNDSAYDPLLRWYEGTGHTVIRLRENVGHFALWKADGVFDLTLGRPFVYTDPDVVPDPGSPLDAIDHFAELLKRFPSVNKVGFGLRIDDIPDTYSHKRAVVAWEEQQWRWPVGRGAFFAAIDTTFALYRPGAGARPADAIRTGPPYIARHMSWYVDLDALSEEEAFYRGRASGSTNWTGDELPPWLTSAVERLTTARRPLAVEAIARARTWLRLQWRFRIRPLAGWPATSSAGLRSLARRAKPGRDLDFR